MEFLRRLTYRRAVIAAARSLGLRSILRKWYYWRARLPADVRSETVGDLLRLLIFPDGTLFAGRQAHGNRS